LFHDLSPDRQLARFQVQAYSDEGCRGKRGGRERKAASAAGMQAARQLLEA
jgi:hypothetical protein